MARTDVVIGIFFRPTTSDSKIQYIAESCYRITPQVAIGQNGCIFLEVSKSLNLFSIQGIVSRIHVILRQYSASAQIFAASDPLRCLAKKYISQRSQKTKMSSEIQSHQRDEVLDSNQDRGLNRELMVLEDMSTDSSLHSHQYSVISSSLNFFEDPSWSDLPVEALSCFLDPFHTLDEGEKNEIQLIVHLLKKMGVLNLEVFLKIPIESIGSRFGKLGLILYQHMIGSRELIWRVFQVHSEIEASIDFDGSDSGDSIDRILFISKKLLDSIAMRLRARTLRVTRFLVEFRLEKLSIQNENSTSTIRSLDIQLPIAQGSSLGILPILREKLCFYFDHHPLPSPICSVLIRVLETSPGHASQKNFFNQDDLLVEAHEQLLGRLIAHVGKENVFYAQSVDSYCPEKSWKKTLSLKKNQKDLPQRDYYSRGSNAYGYSNVSIEVDGGHRLIQRPTRILKEPVVLEFESFEMIRSDEQQWKVLYWIGPERLNSEWWISSLRDEGMNRDYYQLITESNEKLWVFFDKNFNPPPLLLHGYFD